MNTENVGKFKKDYWRIFEKVPNALLVSFFLFLCMFLGKGLFFNGVKFKRRAGSEFFIGEKRFQFYWVTWYPCRL